MRPFARPRFITSANFAFLRRRSIVLVVTLNQAAISSSVHCIELSRSSSTKSIFAGVPRFAIAKCAYQQATLHAPIEKRAEESRDIFMARAKR
jgi:hypothetical protein